MDRTTITCTDTDMVVGADILDKSDRYLKVVADGSELSIVLRKNDPYDRFYVGTQAGFEFTSTGD